MLLTKLKFKKKTKKKTLSHFQNFGIKSYCKVLVTFPFIFYVQSFMFPAFFKGNKL